MEEFLIRFGKVLYYGLLVKPTDTLQPQDWQFYNLGLCLFVLGGVSFGILVVAGSAYLVKRSISLWKTKTRN